MEPFGQPDQSVAAGQPEPAQTDLRSVRGECGGPDGGRGADGDRESGDVLGGIAQRRVRPVEDPGDLAVVPDQQMLALEVVVEEYGRVR
nr:hypothetical protein [Streptomyces tsukubensis NRRL18488]